MDDADDDFRTWLKSQKVNPTTPEAWAEWRDCYAFAKTPSSGREDADFMFLDLGTQYYVAARAAASAGLYVCGNLYHHSIEMLLKAGLSRQFSLHDLWKKFSHKLPKIWTSFKARFAGGGELDQFDGTVCGLHRFEEIRHPEKVLSSGAQMRIEWNPGPGTGAFVSPPTPPLYRLVVPDMDRLVARIFEALQRNPAVFMSDPRAREIIAEYNPVATWLLPRTEQS